MIGSLMIDIAGSELNTEDIALLQHPAIGGLILFARNIISPEQVRDLTDHIRQIHPDILIAVDQEGGRVQRLKSGFTRLPPMGALGQLYNNEPEAAVALSTHCGYLMASEVLAVGIDFSFAPVLDLDKISQVIGDRGFHRDAHAVIALASAFMCGMSRAGMATTGKHFPGHGSTIADSHIAEPIDSRHLDDIMQNDMHVFAMLISQLDAIMPAHVIYTQADPNPAGFSLFWLQHMLREQLQFDGVIFSDDLSMQAACIVGDASTRLSVALQAGCDMGLICNDRSAARQALTRVDAETPPNQIRLARMKGRIHPRKHLNYWGEQLILKDAQWATAKTHIEQFSQLLTTHT